MTGWGWVGGVRCTRGKRGGPPVWLRSSRGLWAVGQMGAEWGFAVGFGVVVASRGASPSTGPVTAVARTPRTPLAVVTASPSTVTGKDASDADSNARHTSGPGLRHRERTRIWVGAFESQERPRHAPLRAPSCAYAPAARSAIYWRRLGGEHRADGVGGPPRGRPRHHCPSWPSSSELPAPVLARRLCLKHGDVRHHARHIAISKGSVQELLKKCY